MRESEFDDDEARRMRSEGRCSSRLVEGSSTSENQVTDHDGSAYRRLMEVTFTKVDRKRYTVAIERRLGPPLVPRFGPGSDALVPHDLAHFLVEEYFGIELGVWGQLAAGGGGIFFPVPEENTLRYQRRVGRIGHVGRADIQRSERLVGITVAAWERAVGGAEYAVSPVQDEVGPRALADSIRRLSETAGLWGALAPGDSLVREWSTRLAFDASKSHRGRRTTRPTPHRARHSRLH